ncbi:MAG: DUF2834 domain-containing protein [Blastocatellia bacterium]
MKRLYALLCVLGLVLPYYFFIPFLLSNGLDIPLVISLLFGNQISAFFAADVFVSSVVLWVFIYHENRNRRIRQWWLCIVANLAVGVSLALPLFLWLRQTEIEKMK